MAYLIEKTLSFLCYVLMTKKQTTDEQQCQGQRGKLNENVPSQTKASGLFLFGRHRFTLRSKRKVDVQWTRTRFALVAQARNIGKIHSFGAIL